MSSLAPCSKSNQNLLSYKQIPRQSLFEPATREEWEAFRALSEKGTPLHIMSYHFLNVTEVEGCSKWLKKCCHIYLEGSGEPWNLLSYPQAPGKTMKLILPKTKVEESQGEKIYWRLTVHDRAQLFMMTSGSVDMDDIQPQRVMNSDTKIHMLLHVTSSIPLESTWVPFLFWYHYYHYRQQEHIQVCQLYLIGVEQAIM